MSRTNISTLILVGAVVLSLGSAQAVTIDWVPVDDAGNANDLTTGGLYGGVAYDCRIAKNDVTNSQYVEFLNAKDPAGANLLGLYNTTMSSAVRGGINFNSASLSGTKYSVVAGRGDHPVNFVTWFDAIRFTNWMNNGQANGDTESGAYTLLGGTPTPSNGNTVSRSAEARIVLPTENEWYKAAFYDPATLSYFQYATSSNLAATPSGPTAAANSANYSNAVDNPTDVGSYPGSPSPYGTLDQSGNVYQWLETIVQTSGPVYRAYRGGEFGSPAGPLSSASRNYATPVSLNGGVGFRLAIVPEPSTFLLGGVAFGCVGLRIVCSRRRRRLARV